MGAGIAGFATMATICLLYTSISTVGPTEYGILFNRLTGSVYSAHPRGAGIYFISPVLGFHYFPAYNRTLELSNKRWADGPSIECRTGPDENDPDSGGQPVTLHLSFVYRIRKEDISKIYQSFAMYYEQRLVMFARQAAGDIVQRFEPTLFWQNRKLATDQLLKELKHELKREGFVQVHSIQLLGAAFNRKYEATIIGIQLATQARTTSQYRQQVVRVLKEIDILEAETIAKVTKIYADADAFAEVLTNNVTNDGFSIVQDAKANGYHLFYQKLGWRQADILKYMQIQSIHTHDSDGLMVGIGANTDSATGL